MTLQYFLELPIWDRNYSDPMLRACCGKHVCTNSQPAGGDCPEEWHDCV